METSAAMTLAPMRRSPVPSGDPFIADTSSSVVREVGAVISTILTVFTCPA